MGVTPSRARPCLPEDNEKYRSLLTLPPILLPLDYITRHIILSHQLTRFLFTDLARIMSVPSNQTPDDSLIAATSTNPTLASASTSPGGDVDVRYPRVLATSFFSVCNAQRELEREEAKRAASKQEESERRESTQQKLKPEELKSEDYDFGARLRWLSIREAVQDDLQSLDDKVSVGGDE